MSKQSDETQIAVVQRDIEYIKKNLDGINVLLQELRRLYVTREEFWPVRAVVYGCAGLILLGVLAAIVLMATNGVVRIYR